MGIHARVAGVDGHSHPKRAWISIHACNSGVDGDPRPFRVPRGAWLASRQSAWSLPTAWSFSSSSGSYSDELERPQAVGKLLDKREPLQLVGKLFRRTGELQLVGIASRRAGEAPGRQEATPTAWRGPSLSESLYDKLERPQAVGKLLQRPGAPPACRSSFLMAWGLSSSSESDSDKLGPLQAGWLDTNHAPLLIQGRQFSAPLESEADYCRWVKLIAKKKIPREGGGIFLSQLNPKQKKNQTHNKNLIAKTNIRLKAAAAKSGTSHQAVNNDNSEEDDSDNEGSIIGDIDFFRDQIIQRYGVDCCYDRIFLSFLHPSDITKYIPLSAEMVRIWANALFKKKSRVSIDSPPSEFQYKFRQKASAAPALAPPAPETTVMNAAMTAFLQVAADDRAQSMANRTATHIAPFEPPGMTGVVHGIVEKSKISILHTQHFRYHQLCLKNQTLRLIPPLLTTDGNPQALLDQKLQLQAPAKTVSGILKRNGFISYRSFTSPNLNNEYLMAMEIPLGLVIRLRDGVSSFYNHLNQNVV
ncbi:hypothetical protein MJO29_016956 [Puccinia striiformis f. sp. tritici]|nr:hypothetical protein MJO29_016956 [Puccinia striiformis f. sp. tritici]